MDSVALETEINAFILCRLPPRTSKTYFCPCHVASFLLHFKCVKILGVKVSRKRLMEHMISYKYVLVKQTSMYKICRKLKLKDMPHGASWTELQKQGRKPMISNCSLQQLIRDIKMSTDSGVAMSTSDVRSLVVEHIKEDWSSRGKLHCLPDISVNTLNIYSNIIKSQGIFNIHSSVANKTQARAAAEWLICSTISYAMVIACTLSLPTLNLPTFIQKRKTLVRRVYKCGR